MKLMAMILLVFAHFSLHSVVQEYAVSKRDGMGVHFHEDGSEDRYVFEKISDKEFIFGVFDGHSGSQVAEYASTHFVPFFREQKSKLPFLPSERIPEFLAETFVRFDISLAKKETNYLGHYAGSTACLVYIKDTTLYCANLGDSRAILVSKKEIIPLSSDHKPTKHKEAERIYNAGGLVQGGRVKIEKDSGGLEAARAFGHNEFKNYSVKSDEISTHELLNLEHVISNRPEITEHELTCDDEYIIIATDGLWDTVSNENATELLRKKLSGSTTLQEAADWLTYIAHTRYSNDDITAIVVSVKR